ncbi:hypothetical protein VV01_06110 [Luteipulveratus halotolerans]|uniref:DUF1365 domain-containing protein n=1 Tax=Luteipulveratus halotolerans TaxID=1631356 RepID=A0A0L6CH25_9MICO|nr:DUF1365 family protein [Luteipulveratus halotolerans]KNX36818.1 hypothetical protein VV01_06110 [Luteipulveratus halotolerans]
MRPRLLLTQVRHTRTAPVRDDFTYAGCAWLVEPSTSHEMPWWQRPFVTFGVADHLGDPRACWHDNVVRFAETQGLDLDGCRVLALTGARSLGHAFDPLTIYWCWDRDDALVAVIAEVRNTYGERHAYLVRPDSRGRASAEKALYVSPFNDVSGHYAMSVPPPTAAGVDIRITLHRDGHPPFVTSWRGRPARPRDAPRVLLRLPLAPHVVTLRIRLRGVRLWLRRVPVQPRPAHHRQEAV